MDKKELFLRYPALKSCEAALDGALESIVSAFRKGGKLLLCGNGGSAADCGHIVGELMKGFLLKRPVPEEIRETLKNSGEDGEWIADRLQGGLPAVSLPAQAEVLSAFANDVEPALVYAQLVYGYAKPEDVFVGISTSGNSKNVVYAARVAKALGLTTLALTGQGESSLLRICDITIRVPETETYKVQELHLPVYHYLCAEAEKRFFSE